MYLGLDLGTSGIKAVLTDARGAVLAQETTPLLLANPHPLWSEQAPEDWWRAACGVVAALRRSHDLGAVRAVGLSGQMHGAVLLDAEDRVLRPAILWNDGRSAAECAALEQAEPRSRAITGNLAMPGFTAPKLLWVRTHEPACFAATSRVLLPKDWLRLRMTGEAISEMSDASGTLWLDVGRRCWSDVMLAACGLDRGAMPDLVEGTAPAGRLRAEVAAEWGLPTGCLVVGGAGDNAAGAIGIGCIAPGQGFVSLGTSGVVFVADEKFLPDPVRGVHAFCHCLPQTWHRMSVILSAASALSWITRVTGATDEAALLFEVEAAGEHDSALIFHPYLAGERTPHNDAGATGGFFGLSHRHARADLGRAVLEGVAFALADGLDALDADMPALMAIGGGARSSLWLRIIAAALGRTLLQVEGGEVGPALGAARLARIGCGDATIPEACIAPRVIAEYAPDRALAERLAPRRARFRAIYPALRAVRS